MKFGSICAVDRLSLSVETGEVFALLGPNGAGKTTTIRVITTLLSPDSGSATVLGLDVKRGSMGVRSIMGYVPQQLSIDGGLTGWENVWLFARLFDVPRQQRPARIREVLNAVGLLNDSQRLAKTYSGGMVRRLELAQALVNRPQLLVLDEPTIGLDPLGREAVWERVLALREEMGVTVLFTTHYMEEADQVCDRLALMHAGKIRALGNPQDLKAQLGVASLDDVFKHFAGVDASINQEDFRSVRSTRRTAKRLG